MSEDLIKREDAIEALYKYSFVSKDVIEKEIKAIPSADRPQGEWEIVGKNHPYKRCPFCKRVRAFTDTRFCDWCGARMKGADDEV